MDDTEFQRPQVQLWAPAGVFALCGCVLLNPAFDDTNVTSSPVSAAGSDASTSISTSISTSTTGATTNSTTTTDAATADLTSTSTSDSTATADSSTGPDTEGADTPSCVGHGPDLVACYHFPEDSPGTLIDGSLYGHHGLLKEADLVASPFDVGAEHGEASDIRYLDGVDAAEPLDFADGRATLLTAVRINEYAPQGLRSAVLDKGGQYSLFIFDTGDIRCQFGNFADNTGVKVPLDEWTHIACVFDATEIRVYVNGEEAAVFSHETALNQGPDNDLVIAADSPDLDARLHGAIDNVELWAAALSPDMICERAGPLCAP